MTGGKSRNKARSVPTTPEQHQEVDFEEEGEEEEAEDQQDEQASTVSLQKDASPAADDAAAGADP